MGGGGVGLVPARPLSYAKNSVSSNAEPERRQYMRCSSCNQIVDSDSRSLICPHPKLDDLPAPTGGFRFPPEARDGIDHCIATADHEGLNRYRYHPNPLVRAYAAKIAEAFRKKE